MARDFDGTDDQIAFGSDASIDNFTTFTIALWMRADLGASVSDSIANKRDAAGTTGWHLSLQTFDNKLHFNVAFSGTDGEWTIPYTPGGVDHLVVVYDGGATTNDPTIYLNGVAQTVTEASTPVGTLSADAANTLQIGELSTGGADFDGLIQAFAYDNTLWSGDQVRRHMRYGMPAGGTASKLSHPLWTSDLANRAAATANGTATGTTVDNASVPKVERMWGSMMGCGR